MCTVVGVLAGVAAGTVHLSNLGGPWSVLVTLTAVPALDALASSGGLLLRLRAAAGRRPAAAVLRGGSHIGYAIRASNNEVKQRELMVEDAALCADTNMPVLSRHSVW